MIVQHLILLTGTQAQRHAQQRAIITSLSSGAARQFHVQAAIMNFHEVFYESKYYI